MIRFKCLRHNGLGWVAGVAHHLMRRYALIALELEMYTLILS
ncbi:hypothetical protein VAEU17_3250002 [Vibrio aestuarianus]|nr:hypothetical protein VAEU17_3250002 [Vibrio aestuarianus]